MCKADRYVRVSPFEDLWPSTIVSAIELLVHVLEHKLAITGFGTGEPDARSGTKFRLAVL